MMGCGHEIGGLERGGFVRGCDKFSQVLKQKATRTARKNCLLPYAGKIREKSMGF